jgi:transcriptional regulator with AAA-type ATPase domain
MSRNFDKEKFKEKIISFVKEENKKGHFPTYKEIQRRFRCLVKLHFPGGIREIAKLAGIKYNRKFAAKTPEERESIREKIIKYAIQKLRNGFYPGFGRASINSDSCSDWDFNYNICLILFWLVS